MQAVKKIITSKIWQNEIKNWKSAIYIIKTATNSPSFYKQYNFKEGRGELEGGGLIKRKSQSRSPRNDASRRSGTSTV